MFELVPILGVLSGIIIPVSVFIWLYFAGKDKNKTIIKIAKHMDDPSKAEEFLRILDERKKPLSINNFDELINEVSKKLDSDKSYVSLDFNYFRRKKAPVTKVESFLDYAVSFIGEKNNEILNKFIKVTVPVTSLCPCSKNISDYGAHNQRSHISALIRVKKNIWIDC